MAARPIFSEIEILEQYRIALDNAEKQPIIAAMLADLGFNSQEIGVGKAILAETSLAYNNNKTEDNETSEAYAYFFNIKSKLEDNFDSHRKKAKVVFRKYPLIASKLAISGAMPRTYIKWLQATKIFYNLASTDTGIQRKLSRLMIFVDDLTAANILISDVEIARSSYLREKGESPEATKVKDAAFVKIDDWMSEFYAVAKIGLEDNPHLLDALSKIAKN